MTSHGICRWAALTLASSAMVVSGAAVAGTGVAGSLRAGAARMSITPASDAFPYASPSSPRDKPFVAVHDDIFARALVLDNGAKRLVLAAIENVNVPQPEAMVAALAQAAQVPPAQVFVFATHTHSNPLVFFHGHEPSARQAQEMARTQSAAVDAVKQAVAQLAPARIGFVRGKGWVNINNGEASTGVKTGDPLAPSDKSLDIVQVVAANGAPMALLVDYATHAEVMFRSMTRPDGLEVTGDLPGAVSRLLENGGAAPVVLYAPGAEGDQLSQYKSLQAEAGGLPEKDEGASGWALLDVQARSLAASVYAALKTAPAPVAQVSLGATTGQAVCPGIKRERDPSGAIVEKPAPDVVIPLALARLGPVTLAGVGADLGSELGKAVKAAFPQQRASVVTMIAGAVGYILPDASYALPTHAVMGSPVKPGCAPRAILDGIKGLVPKL
jgi:hypothetical protein